MNNETTADYARHLYSCMFGPGSYAQAIWERRHFCVHLAMSDIRSRFRRSHLGLAWATLQPVLLTAIMSLVLAAVFNQPYREFSLYVFSGLIVWEFIVGSINAGAGSLIGGEGYLRQIRLPIALFPIKSVIFCFVFYLCGLVGYFLYTAIVAPATLTLYALFVLPVSLLLFLFCLPLAVISSIINTQFRDFLQCVALLLQMLWYLSPVFVAREIFERGILAQWTRYNPIAAVCDLLRDALIQHAAPSLEDLRLLLASTVVLWVIAIYLLWRNESRIIFYL